MSKPESQPDTVWQVGHASGHGSHDDYLAREDTPSKETIIELHRIREQHKNLRANLWKHVQDEDTRKILTSVYFANGRGVRYESLTDRLRCSERTIYRKLNELENDGVIERDGKPILVVYPSDDARMLAGDILDAHHDA